MEKSQEILNSIDIESHYKSLLDGLEFYKKQQELINKKLLRLKLSSFYGNDLENGKLLVDLFLPKETGINTNIYYYWRKENLIAKDAKNWTNINFVDYIWMQILLTLKNMAVPLPLVHEIKNNLFSKQSESFNVILKSLNDNLKAIDASFQLSNVKEIANKLINNLYDHIVSCLNNKPIFITIDENKNIQIGEDCKIDTTVLVIPISKYIQAFFEDDSKQKFWTATGILSDGEAHLIGAYQYYQNNHLPFVLFVDYEYTAGRQVNDIKTLKEILVFKKYKTIHNEMKELVIER